MHHNPNLGVSLDVASTNHNQITRYKDWGQADGYAANYKFIAITHTKPGAVFTKLFVRKFVRTKSYEVRKKVRKCDSPNFLTKFVKIRCVSGRERNKPISRNYTTHAAANGKSFYTEREKALDRSFKTCENNNYCGCLWLQRMPIEVQSWRKERTLVGNVCSDVWPAAKCRFCHESFFLL